LYVTSDASAYALVKKVKKMIEKDPDPFGKRSRKLDKSAHSIGFMTIVSAKTLNCNGSTRVALQKEEGNLDERRSKTRKAGIQPVTLVETPDCTSDGVILSLFHASNFERTSNETGRNFLTCLGSYEPALREVACPRARVPSALSCEDASLLIRTVCPH
jgi:hypothetical protein